MKKTKTSKFVFHDPEWQEVFGTLVENPYEDIPDDLFDVSEIARRL